MEKNQDSYARKAAAEMVAFAKQWDIEPNAEKVLEKFCYRYFVGHAAHKYSANEMFVNQLRLRLDKLLEDYPCDNETEIKRLCRYTAAAFLALSYVDDMAVLSRLLDD